MSDFGIFCKSWRKNDLGDCFRETSKAAGKKRLKVEWKLKSKSNKRVDKSKEGTGARH